MTEQIESSVPNKRKRNDVSVPKSVRIQGGMARARGFTRHGFVRQMAEAEADYQEWRRTGFKGAWWGQYFKGQDSV